MSIQKIGQHLSKTYYKVTAGYDTQILAISRFNDYTEDQILEAYPDAKLPSYIRDIDECFNNPLRIFNFTIYKFGVELMPTNMSAWEYETIIKGEENANPALKMAYISQDREGGTFCINCEAYDEESMVTTKNMKIVESWIAERKQEIATLLNKEYEFGDVLYSY